MNELISIRQLPVIEERLKDLSADIDKQVSEALSLAVTPDTVKAVKTVRAGLNKQFAELEEQRKSVKNAILEPYSRFEEVYKQYVSGRFKTADTELKRKIDGVEGQLKKEKEDELRLFFEELCKANHVEWLRFYMCPVNVTLSASKTSLHDRVTEFVCRVAEDLRCIQTQEFRDEIIVEYKTNLRMADAIDNVMSRHEELERQKVEAEARAKALEAERAAEEKVEEVLEEVPEPLAPPVEEPTEEPKKQETLVFQMAFTVTGTIEQLKKIKNFMDTEGIKYE